MGNVEVGGNEKFFFTFIFSKTEKFITEKNQLDKENWNRKIFILDKNCSEKKKCFMSFSSVVCCYCFLLL